MANLGGADASIKDGKLTSVAFMVLPNKIDDVFANLKNKYGKNVAIKNYKLQNGYGASKDYYIATWSFPNLVVTFASSAVMSLSNEDFGQVTISLPQIIANQTSGRGL